MAGNGMEYEEDWVSEDSFLSQDSQGLYDDFGNIPHLDAPGTSQQAILKSLRNPDNRRDAPQLDLPGPSRIEQSFSFSPLPSSKKPKNCEPLKRLPGNGNTQATSGDITSNESSVWWKIPRASIVCEEEGTVTFQDGVLTPNEITIQSINNTRVWKPVNFSDSRVLNLMDLSAPYVPERKPKEQRRLLKNMLATPILAKRVPPESEWSLIEENKFGLNLSETVREILDSDGKEKPKEQNLIFSGKDDFSKNFFKCMAEDTLNNATTDLKGPLEGKSRPLKTSAFKDNKQMREKLGKLVSAYSVLELARSMTSFECIADLNLSNAAFTHFNMLKNVLDSGLQLLQPTIQELASEFKNHKIACRRSTLDPIKTTSIREIFEESPIFEPGMWSQETVEKATEASRVARADGTFSLKGQREEGSDLGKLLRQALVGLRRSEPSRESQRGTRSRARGFRNQHQGPFFRKPENPYPKSSYNQVYPDQPQRGFFRGRGNPSNRSGFRGVPRANYRGNHRGTTRGHPRGAHRGTTHSNLAMSEHTDSRGRNSSSRGNPNRNPTPKQYGTSRRHGDQNQ